MRKFLATVLALVMVLSLSTVAFAEQGVGSAAGSSSSSSSTADVPVVVEKTTEETEEAAESEVTIVGLNNGADFDKLPEEQREACVAAQEALKEVTVEDMTAKFFFFAALDEGKDAGTVTVELENVESVDDVVFMYFNGTEWIKIAKEKVTKDGKNFSFDLDGSYPIAIFTK